MILSDAAKGCSLPSKSSDLVTNRSPTSMI